MKAKVTETRLNEMNKKYSEKVGEPVTVDIIKGTLYVFGSELATLRLYRQYRWASGINQDYSENLKTWYACWYCDLIGLNEEGED